MIYNNITILKDIKTGKIYRDLKDYVSRACDGDELLACDRYVNKRLVYQDVTTKNEKIMRSICEYRMLDNDGYLYRPPVQTMSDF